MSSRQQVHFAPQPGPQTMFLSTPAEIAIMGGAAGGGKTWSLLFDPLRNARKPNFSGVVFRRQAKDIAGSGSLWEQSKEIYTPFGGDYREAPQMFWRWKGGGMLEFTHLQFDSDTERMKGRAFAFIGFEELTEFTEYQWVYMLSRNRSAYGFRPYMRATTNPHADSFVREWVDWWIGDDGYAIPERSGKVRWVARPGDELIWGDTKEELEKYKIHGKPLQPKSFTFIAANLYDNKILMEQDPGYEGSLQLLDRVERGRLYGGERGGNWNIRPASGEYFSRTWVGEPIRREDLPDGLELVRAWDLAATSAKENPDADWTCGTLMGRDREDNYYVINHIFQRLTPKGVEDLVLRTAQADGIHVQIGMPQEPAAAGKIVKHQFTQALHGYKIVHRPQTGNKIARFGPFSAKAERGNVKVVEGAWNARWFSELENFPPERKRGHDDDADATALAFDVLSRGRVRVRTRNWGY